jgi:RNA polymerase sigma-70 factor (ECF subfamily)
MVKIESTAEDLTQESLITAYRQIETFQRRASFFTWLWRIAHNKALGWLRKQKKEATIEFKEELYHPAEKKEKEVVAGELLAFLPEKQRRVYQMFEIEHLSQKEIAVRLGIPPGTVRSRIHYARKRLGKYLI